MKELNCLNKKKIFIDLDGTLYDSFAGIMQGLEYAHKKANIPMQYKDIMSVIGPPLVETFAKFIDDKKLVWQMVLWYREKYEDTGWKNGSLYNGIEEVLKELNERGYNVYVATCKPTGIATKIIDYYGLSKYFLEIFGVEETGDTPHLNKKEVLEYALEKTNSTVEESLMIGDSSSDYNGAKAHNMDFGAVLYGYGAKDIESSLNFFNVMTAIEILNYLPSKNCNY